MSDTIQRSNEWHAERLGVLTSTRSAAIMGTARAQKTLMNDMIVEIATADRERFDKSRAMLKGINDEPQAIKFYSAFIQAEHMPIETDYYAVASFHPMIGDSPDGLVGSDGLLEVKNLSPKNHFEVMDEQAIPKDHYHQCLWHLMVNEDRSWCDYFSYCKELPVAMQFYLQRIVRESVADEIDDMKTRALTFLDALTDKLRRYGMVL